MPGPQAATASRSDSDSVPGGVMSATRASLSDIMVMMDRLRVYLVDSALGRRSPGGHGPGPGNAQAAAAGAAAHRRRRLFKLRRRLRSESP